MALGLEAELLSRHYPNTGIHGRIVHEIGASICSGEVPPGVNLPDQAALIEHFQASRTALREALKVLASKGLIEARQRAGTRVRPQADWDLLDPDVLSWLTPETVSPRLAEDLVELREVIEPKAARLAAERAAEWEVARIGEAYGRMEEAGEDFESFFKADLDFHLSVVSACHNQLIQRLGSIIGTVLSLSFRMQKEVPLRLADGLPAHKEVYRSIADGDRGGAERAMRKTIKRGRENMANWHRRRHTGRA